jgi:hypothetical protein
MEPLNLKALVDSLTSINQDLKKMLKHANQNLTLLNKYVNTLQKITKHPVLDNRLNRSKLQEYLGNTQN